MDEDDGRQGAGAQVHKGSIPAEDGGVAELEEGAEKSGYHGGVGVGESELVEVVDMGDAEVERREEDDAARGDVCEDMEGDYGGAEHDFFGYGALETYTVSLYVAVFGRA